MKHVASGLSFVGSRAAKRPRGGTRPRLNRAPVLRFLVRFGLILTAFYLVSIQDHFERWIYVPVLRVTAALSAGVLSGLGEPVELDGVVLRSDRGGVAVRRGCDPLEPFLLLAAAILAYPTSFRRKWPALVLGFGILGAVNLLRVTSLYWIRTRVPSLFDLFHLEVWPITVIALTLALWVVWVRRAPPNVPLTKAPSVAAEPVCNPGP